MKITNAVTPFVALIFSFGTSDYGWTLNLKKLGEAIQLQSNLSATAARFAAAAALTGVLATAAQALALLLLRQ